MKKVCPECKSCASYEESIGTGCKNYPIDEYLPLPDKPSVMRVSLSNERDDGNVMNVTWNLIKKENAGIRSADGFELMLSENNLFEGNEVTSINTNEYKIKCLHLDGQISIM